ncbi:MAG: LrgB family protein [Lachnospiraceae bacterium]|nr:LrgB family protein [Lachnospiraceae bacterium]
MKEFVSGSLFFGLFISVLCYEIGLLIKKKWKMAVLNPLLISILMIILLLLITGVDYDSYNASGKYLSYLLTPATVCLAIPLYRELAQLKRNWKAILAGTVAGVLTSMGSILILSAFFGLTHVQYVTLLPKSITTAIGMGVSEELGGMVNVTVAAIVITGILGNMCAELVCRLFRIEEPVAKGLAIGSASHAIGTARAMQMGEIEGAISSLSIAVSGLLTVAGASVFAGFL